MTTRLSGDTSRGGLGPESSCAEQLRIQEGQTARGGHGVENGGFVAARAVTNLGSGLLNRFEGIAGFWMGAGRIRSRLLD